MQSRRKVIACATVIEEMLPLIPPDTSYQILAFGLHINPPGLRQALQDAIDASVPEADTIMLGYGLCSRAVVGLRANDCTLVIPRVDDCIALFLGSGSAYKEQTQSQPGTYYLTKGWIEVGDSPFSEYDRLLKKYGREKGEFIVRQMLKHYKRLALINTGQYDIEHYREWAVAAAERFGLRYEEIAGAPALIRKLLFGPWDGGEFVVVPRGQTVLFEHFFPRPELPGGKTMTDTKE